MMLRGVVGMKNANEEYHNYLKWILSDELSVFKESRAGGTIANTGATMRFDLSKGIPLINTKKLFYRGLIHEMVWFMRGPEQDGQLHIDYLLENKCDFWNKDLHNFYLLKNGVVVKNLDERENLFREFEAKLKKDSDFRKINGGLGRPYGAQWRDWRGANGEHIDQLADAFRSIKAKSDSRRIIVEAWKVDELNLMALPPCPKDFQFVVMNDRLDFDLVQRSADSFLGVPFNIGEYGLLAIFAANYANLKPGVFTHHIVDAHIYCGVGGKAEWYKNNLDELKYVVGRANSSGDYLSIKKWIEDSSKLVRDESKEKYDHVTGVLEQLANDVNRYGVAKLDVKVDRRKKPSNLLNSVKFEDFKISGYENNHYQKIIREMSTG